MFYFAAVLLMAGIFGLAAAAAEIEYTTLGQHIGSAIAVTLLAGWVMSLVLGPVTAGDIGWLAMIAAQGVFVWLLSWPMTRLFYSASGRQAVIMATVAAVGYTLLGLFWRWAVST